MTAWEGGAVPDLLLIGNLAEVAIALNLAYLGLERFHFRKAIRQHTQDAILEVGDAEPVENAEARTLIDQGGIALPLENFAGIKETALKRLRRVSDGEETWGNSNYKNIYVTLFKSGADRFLAINFAAYSLFLLFFGTISDSNNGSWMSSLGANLFCIAVIFGVIYSTSVIASAIICAFSCCIDNRIGTRKFYTIILFISLFSSTYIHLSYKMDVNWIFFGSLLVFFGCLFPAILWFLGRHTEKSAESTIDYILSATSESMMNLSKQKIDSSLSSIRKKKAEMAARAGALATPARDIE